MKILTLTDGTELEVSDLSTFGDIVMVFATRAEAGSYWSNFTDESLRAAKLGDEAFSAIPQSMHAELDETNNNVTAHYVNYVVSPKAKFAEDAVEAPAEEPAE